MLIELMAWNNIYNGYNRFDESEQRCKMGNNDTNNNNINLPSFLLLHLLINSFPTIASHCQNNLQQNEETALFCAKSTQFALRIKLSYYREI